MLIFKSIKFYWLRRSGGSRHITMPNFVKICSSIADIKIFQFFKMSAIIILNLKNHNILLANRVYRAETHHRAIFCQNWSNLCWDIAIFWLFKMATAIILDFKIAEILFTDNAQRAQSHHCEILSKSVIPQTQVTVTLITVSPCTAMLWKNDV